MLKKYFPGASFHIVGRLLLELVAIVFFVASFILTIDAALYLSAAMFLSFFLITSCMAIRDVEIILGYRIEDDDEDLF